MPTTRGPGMLYPSDPRYNRFYRFGTGDSEYGADGASYRPASFRQGTRPAICSLTELSRRKANRPFHADSTACFRAHASLFERDHESSKISSRVVFAMSGRYPDRRSGGGSSGRRIRGFGRGSHPGARYESSPQRGSLQLQQATSSVSRPAGRCRHRLAAIQAVTGDGEALHHRALRAVRPRPSFARRRDRSCEVTTAHAGRRRPAS